MQLAVIRDCNRIIKVQAGATKPTEAERLSTEANQFCDLICDDLHFWNGLEQVVGDLKLICYGTNINHRDSTHADIVLITLVGMYFHFDEHPITDMKAEMLYQIEK